MLNAEPLRLPLELIERCLHSLAAQDVPCLPDGAASPAVVALLHARSASRLLRDIVDADALWCGMCQRRWTSPVGRGFNMMGFSWRLIYAGRHLHDAAALAGLQGIVEEPSNRLTRMSALSEANRDGATMSEVLYATWMDATKSLRAWTEQYRIASQQNMPKQLLSYLYWSKELWSALRRAYVAHRWATGVDLDFEEGVALFSAFRQADMGAVEVQLAVLAERTRQSLLRDAIDPKESRAVVSAIWTSLRETGLGPARTAEEFRCRTGSFIDCVLLFEKNVLPMSLIWVFCAVASRLGISASAVNWPGTVLAVIHSAREGFTPQGELCTYEAPLYINLFEFEFSTYESLSARLASLPINLPEPLHYLHLQPAKPRDLVARTARNIIDSNVTMTPIAQWTRRDTILANFAAICALVLSNAGVGGRGIVTQPQPHFVESVLDECPLDVSLLKRVTLPRASVSNVATRDLNSIFTRIEAQDAPKQTSPGVEMHRVGLIFRHKKYDYCAVVLGWDPHCQASSEWQRVNRIADLEHGSDQPFMHSLRSDTYGTHYVANENVVPLEASASLSAAVLSLVHFPKIGYYFEDFDVERNRFSLGANLRAEYKEAKDENA